MIEKIIFFAGGLIVGLIAPIFTKASMIRKIFIEVYDEVSDRILAISEEIEKDPTIDNNQKINLIAKIISINQLARIKYAIKKELEFKEGKNEK